MNLFTELERIILIDDAALKCQATHEVYAQFEGMDLDHNSPVNSIKQPGYPPQLELVAPKQ